MKLTYFLTALALASSMNCMAATPKKSLQPKEPIKLKKQNSLKIDNGYHNPLVEFNFNADPTAVEYNGRLYVYGTNDQQQCDETSTEHDNSYERINSLVMLSTDDMVNWQWHGIIPTKKLAPWIIASWAPSITSRVEADGKTHFYMYFSNSGFGSGVLTATSPTGPWSSPLSHSVVDANTPGLGDCNVPFDPGVAIDDNGQGWLAFGAGRARVARLSDDMLSLVPPIVKIPAPHHFEANELNFMNGKMVYTYNTDWQSREDWKEDAPAPTLCTMNYMLPSNPLDSLGWKHIDTYKQNPGDEGFEFCNNHTHIHKYKGHWYLFHHNMVLKTYRGIKGGYRSMGVDEIQVDESIPAVRMARGTNKGVKQLQWIDPTVWIEMETTAGTSNMAFDEVLQVNSADTIHTGNFLARLEKSEKADDYAVSVVRGVELSEAMTHLQLLANKTPGQVDVRLDAVDGPLLVSTLIDSADEITSASFLLNGFRGPHDVFFIIKGKDVAIDKWRISE